MRSCKKPLSIIDDHQYSQRGSLSTLGLEEDGRLLSSWLALKATCSTIQSSGLRAWLSPILAPVMSHFFFFFLHYRIQSALSFCYSFHATSWYSAFYSDLVEPPAGKGEAHLRG